MDKVLSVFVIGLSYGLVLFLVATGLSLTMGLMRIVNMAHGALYMFGGYVGLWVAKQSNFWFGALAAAAACGLIGLVLEMGFLRKLYKREESQVLLTIGFIYILMDAAQWIWTSYPMAGPVPSILSGSVQVGSSAIPTYRLFLIGFGLLMAVLLWLFQDKTKVGARVRAGMDKGEVASALGINLKVLFTGVFVLGALVAGLSGLMGAKITGVKVGNGWEILLHSLIVVVVGGAGSIQGALLGGTLLGLLDAFGKAYFPSVAAYIMYIALIVILLVRPSGLLGRKFSGGDSGENLERARVYTKGAHKRLGAAGLAAGARPVWQTLLKRYLPYVLVLVVLTAVPPLFSGFPQFIFTKVLIFGIFAMSLDLIMGYTGLLSFGHAAYLAMAGYVTGILTLRYGVHSFWLVLLIALAITAALAAVIGFLSLRVSGVYFLLVTMGFGQLLAVVADKWYSMTGGKDGMPGIKRPDLGWNVDWTNLKYYFFVLAFFVFTYVVLKRMTRSGFGRTLTGIRENEPRMKSLGYNTWASKYTTIIIAGVFAGLAGIFYAQLYGTMVPRHFGLEYSALPMLMVIMGGGATLWGPCLGAAVIVLFEWLLTQSPFARWVAERWHTFPQRWWMWLGILFVVCVVFLRGGFARYLTRLWEWVWRPHRVVTAPADQVAERGGES
jgi:branched-chain amino acid transport system permease protein